MRIFGRTELFKLQTPILGLLIFYLLPKKHRKFWLKLCSKSWVQEQSQQHQNNNDPIWQAGGSHHTIVGHCNLPIRATPSQCNESDGHLFPLLEQRINCQWDAQFLPLHVQQYSCGGLWPGWLGWLRGPGGDWGGHRWLGKGSISYKANHDVDTTSYF